MWVNITHIPIMVSKEISVSEATVSYIFGIQERDLNLKENNGKTRHFAECKSKINNMRVLLGLQSSFEVETVSCVDE